MYIPGEIDCMTSFLSGLDIYYYLAIPIVYDTTSLCPVFGCMGESALSTGFLRYIQIHVHTCRGRLLRLDMFAEHVLQVQYTALWYHEEVRKDFRGFPLDLCLTSELCLIGAVTDWTRNRQTPREGGFGSDQDPNRSPPPQESSWAQAENQFIASRPFPVSVSGTILSPSASLVLCWCGKGQHQVMETQWVPEYPLHLCYQTLALQDPPRITT